MSKPKTFLCGLCGGENPVTERHFMDETPLCQSCYDRETVVCDCCGERVWVSDSLSDDYMTICLSCYDRHYTRCIRYDNIISYDDAQYVDEDDTEPYCSNCVPDMDCGEFIQGYYYKPTPIFYGDADRFFGVELEIDEAGEYDENAEILMHLANRTADRAYCKHDGSINTGFEIVTHPMTLQYHREQMPWASMMEKAVQIGYRSHQTETCGLHVHVNRDSLGASGEEREAVIARILFFVENHWNELLRFSRRTQRQISQWAARYGRKDNPKEQIEHVKAQRADRYRAVNLTNYDTIEFRMFRGTLRHSTLIATL